MSYKSYQMAFINYFSSAHCEVLNYSMCFCLSQCLFVWSLIVYSFNLGNPFFFLPTGLWGSVVDEKTLLVFGTRLYLWKYSFATWRLIVTLQLFGILLYPCLFFVCFFVKPFLHLLPFVFLLFCCCQVSGLQLRGVWLLHAVSAAGSLPQQHSLPGGRPSPAARTADQLQGTPVYCTHHTTQNNAITFWVQTWVMAFEKHGAKWPFKVPIFIL